MVVVKVQMWPRGNESKAYSLGTLTIALDPGTSTPNRRNYFWRMYKKGSSPPKEGDQVPLSSPWKSGRIEGHTPKTRGPWDLIFRILRNVVGYRNQI